MLRGGSTLLLLLLYFILVASGTSAANLGSHVNAIVTPSYITNQMKSVDVIQVANEELEDRDAVKARSPNFPSTAEELVSTALRLFHSVDERTNLSQVKEAFITLLQYYETPGVTSLDLLTDHVISLPPSFPFLEFGLSLAEGLHEVGEGEEEEEEGDGEVEGRGRKKGTKLMENLELSLLSLLHVIEQRPLESRSWHELGTACIGILRQRETMRVLSSYNQTGYPGFARIKVALTQSSPLRRVATGVNRIAISTIRELLLELAQQTLRVAENLNPRSAATANNRAVAHLLRWMEPAQGGRRTSWVWDAGERAHEDTKVAVGTESAPFEAGKTSERKEKKTKKEIGGENDHPKDEEEESDPMITLNLTPWDRRRRMADLQLAVILLKRAIGLHIRAVGPGTGEIGPIEAETAMQGLCAARMNFRAVLDKLSFHEEAEKQFAAMPASCHQDQGK